MATKTLYLKQFGKSATRTDTSKVGYEVVKAKNVLEPLVGEVISAATVKELMGTGIEVEITKANR